MRVLITGVAGFIGSNLVKKCLDVGWDVTGVDDMSNGHTEFLPGEFMANRGRFWRNDFADLSVLSQIKHDPFDAVIHLAAVPRVSYSVEHPLETNETNVSKTLKLMEACKGNVKRFVFASSSSVYGGADEMPTHELIRKDPQSPYALQKSVIEDYITLYRKLYGFDGVSLRFFNVFGPNQLGDSPYATALSAWLTAIKKGVPMRSDGDGMQSRDMCYVDNVTDMCVRAAKYEGELQWDRFNVACGDRTTNREILDALLIRYVGSSSVNAPERAGDVKHTQADITSTKAVFGYTPLVRFWEGFGHTCDWYDDNWDKLKDMKLNT